MPKTKLAFFGTPYVARDTLELLAAAGIVPALAVTSPDAPRGRGLALTPSPVKEWALARGIPVLSPATLDATALEAIRTYECELGIAVAYGKILPAALIDSFPKGVLNIHYSLLPQYRGASPVEAALLAGDAVTGVSIQKMVFALDAGDILAAQELPILPEDDARTLRARLIEAGAALLAEILPAYLAGTLPGTPQDHARATRAGKIAKSDGELRLDAPGRENWNKYRAYAESPGTYFFAERGGKRVRVKIAKASLAPDGSFAIERVIPEGKREMAYADFARSHAAG